MTQSNPNYLQKSPSQSHTRASAYDFVGTLQSIAEQEDVGAGRTLSGFILEAHPQDTVFKHVVGAWDILVKWKKESNTPLSDGGTEAELGQRTRPVSC